jgi:hypothetical protein
MLKLFEDFTWFILIVGFAAGFFVCHAAHAEPFNGHEVWEMTCNPAHGYPFNVHLEASYLTVINHDGSTKVYRKLTYAQSSGDSLTVEFTDGDTTANATFDPKYSQSTFSRGTRWDAEPAAKAQDTRTECGWARFGDAPVPSSTTQSGNGIGATPHYRGCAAGTHLAEDGSGGCVPDGSHSVGGGKNCPDGWHSAEDGSDECIHDGYHSVGASYSCPDEFRYLGGDKCLKDQTPQARHSFSYFSACAISRWPLCRTFVWSLPADF